jgi:hypothetical protein
MDAKSLAERYVAICNEVDPGCRRQIAQLWVPGGRHYVGEREVHGYEALERRIAGSHEKNMCDGDHRFRVANDARALNDVVTLHWEMLPSGSDEVVARGLEVLLLHDTGRILVDYQFVVDRGRPA